MAEEQQTPQVPEDLPAPGRRASRGQQRRRQRSVMQYIAILFCAAFVLLLITFFMERRQYEQQQQQDQANIDTLQQQSVSTVQTLKGMTEENAQLKKEAEELQQRIQTLESQLSAAKDNQAAVQDQLTVAEKTVAAMTWFWELNDAYVRGRLNTCRDMIAAMEEAQVVDLLPDENPTGLDYLSPAERYQEIYNRVTK